MANRNYTSSTARALWLKSGNQCAYPTCQKTLLDDAGIFVGEIAHIEGLNPGSARYNPSMTDEERNAPENLMLMCPTHHTEVDKDKRRTVLELKKWKSDHERKYSDISHIFQGVVSDYTAGTLVQYPQNLKGIFPGLTKKERMESAEEVRELIDKLKPIPHMTKSFLAIAVARAHMERGIWFVADLDEIRAVASMPIDDVRIHVNILNTHNIAYYDDDDDMGRHMLRIQPAYSGWNIWNDIQTFFNKDSDMITRMLLDMDFTILDA